MALRNADIVIALWTTASIGSNWVKLEAHEGLRRGRLLNVELRRMTPARFWDAPRVDLRFVADFNTDQSIDQVLRMIDAILSAQHLTPPFESPALGTTPMVLFGNLILHATGVFLAVAVGLDTFAKLVPQFAFYFSLLPQLPPVLLGLLLFGCAISALGFLYVLRAQIASTVVYSAVAVSRWQRMLDPLEPDPSHGDSDRDHCNVAATFLYHPDDRDWAKFLFARFSSVVPAAAIDGVPVNARNQPVGQNAGTLVALLSKQSLLDPLIMSICADAKAEGRLVPLLINDAQPPDAMADLQFVHVDLDDMFATMSSLADASSRLARRFEQRPVQRNSATKLSLIYQLGFVASLLVFLGLGTLYLLAALWDAAATGKALYLPFLEFITLPRWLTLGWAMAATMLFIVGCALFVFLMVQVLSNVAQKPKRRI